MGKFFKKLLDLTLPFSGDKTKIAAWILALTGAQELGIGVDDIIALISAHPSLGGLSLLIVALTHKVLKARYGKAQ